MRILDEETNNPLHRVTLYLTLSEANELSDKVQSLLSATNVHHEHVSSEDYQKEVTLTIYENHPIDSFDERSRKLIKDDV